MKHLIDCISKIIDFDVIYNGLQRFSSHLAGKNSEHALCRRDEMKKEEDVRKLTNTSGLSLPDTHPLRVRWAERPKPHAGVPRGHKPPNLRVESGPSRSEPTEGDEVLGRWVATIPELPWRPLPARGKEFKTQKPKHQNIKPKTKTPNSACLAIPKTHSSKPKTPNPKLETQIKDPGRVAHLCKAVV